MKRDLDAIPDWKDRQDVVDWTLRQLHKPPNIEMKQNVAEVIADFRRRHPELFDVQEAIDKGDEAAFVRMMKKTDYARFAFSLLHEGGKAKKAKRGRPRDFRAAMASAIIDEVADLWMRTFGKKQRRGEQGQTLSDIASRYMSDIGMPVSAQRVFHFRRSVGSSRK